jgi:hypothetical protein
MKFLHLAETFMLPICLSETMLGNDEANVSYCVSLIILSPLSQCPMTPSLWSM